MSSHFGKLFQISTWGESHGGTIGVIVDGCPAGLEIDVQEIQKELDRRKPGQSKITTQRKESDQIEILSGIFEGKTLGTPIAMQVHNQDARPQAYDEMKDLFRPSHADYTYEAKYGLRNWQGGGRSSARETIGRVAAGAIAAKVLKQACGATVLAYVEQIHTIRTGIDPTQVTLDQVESNIVRCPDSETAEYMIQRIDEARKSGDSVGGIIAASVQGLPAGLGEPIFDKLTADLAKALMSLPATRGVEFGIGFESVNLKGSEHNDAFTIKDGNISTQTNYSGGIQGGISNGQPIFLRVAFKPTATINFEQQTVTRDHQPYTLKAKGRHDPCVIPRAVPIVEAMIRLVLVDHYLRHQTASMQCLTS